MKKKTVVVLVSIAALLAFLVVGGVLALGFMITAGAIPDSEVHTGKSLPPLARSKIERIVPLAEDERIEFYYSMGMFSYEEDGNLITDQRIVSYYEDEGATVVDEVRYADVDWMEIEVPPSRLDDTIVTVWPVEGAPFSLYLSRFGKGDEAATAYLRSKIPADRIDSE